MYETAGGSLEEAAWRYVAAARPAQTLVKQTLTQVAGFALLVMTSARSACLAEGALLGAQEVAKQAADAVRALAPPESGAHHFHHLSEAVANLEQACASALLCSRPGASDGERETLTRALRAASDHLRVTANLIPGFELVDLGQACCAAHASLRHQDNGSANYA